MGILEKIAIVMGGTFAAFCIGWVIDLKRKIHRLEAELVLSMQKEQDAENKKKVSSLSDTELDSLLTDHLSPGKKAD